MRDYREVRVYEHDSNARDWITYLLHNHISIDNDGIGNGLDQYGSGVIEALFGLTKNLVLEISYDMRYLKVTYVLRYKTYRHKLEEVDYDPSLLMRNVIEYVYAISKHPSLNNWDRKLGEAYYRWMGAFSKEYSFKNFYEAKDNHITYQQMYVGYDKYHDAEPVIISYIEPVDLNLIHNPFAHIGDSNAGPLLGVGFNDLYRTHIPYYEESGKERDGLDSVVDDVLLQLKKRHTNNDMSSGSIATYDKLNTQRRKNKLGELGIV